MRFILSLVLVSLLSCGKEEAPTPPPPPPPPAPSISGIAPASGSIGSEVVITGANFASAPSANAVKFNGVTATVTQATGTQIITSVPAGASTGKITVTTGNQTTTSAETFTVLSGAWTQKADFGGEARIRAAGFALGGKGYIFTGISPHLTPTVRQNDFWEYDPAANQWTRKANLPGSPRENAVAFSVGGKGYAGLGWMDGVAYVRDFWEYNPQTNQWTRVADFPGNLRESAVAFSAGGKGYVGLGVDYLSSGFPHFKDFWEFTPQTNQWTRVADFPGANRQAASAFALNDKGYVGLGATATQLFKDFWEYNPQTNQWTQKAEFPGGARAQAVAFSIAGNGYLGLGSSASGLQKDIWEYAPATDLWTRKADFTGTPRVELPAFSINNKGYIGTGSKRVNPVSLKDLWEFSPQ